LLFRWTLRPPLIEAARRQAQRGLRGRMEGHAAMDMSVPDGPFWRRLLSGRGLTAVSHNFWMDVTSVWTDIGLGLLIAGALAGLLIGLLFQLLGLVPTHHPVVALVTGPTLNYTSVLNVIFLGIMVLMGWRFLRTGGLEMLRMMERPADEHGHHDHAAHQDGD